MMSNELHQLCEHLKQIELLVIKYKHNAQVIPICWFL